jgi:hypothetical protein
MTEAPEVKTLQVVLTGFPRELEAVLLHISLQDGHIMDKQTTNASASNIT